MRHDPIDEKEWLEADGLGGFAMGTASGRRTRRYHALLVAAASPPGERRVLLEDVEVVAETAAGRFPLTARRYPSPEGDVLHPDVEPVAFHDAPWIRWEWALPDGTLLAQELVVPKGAAQVGLRWRRLAGRGSLRLHVRPFLSGRPFHALERHDETPRFPLRVAAGELAWGLPGPLDVRASPHAQSWVWREDPVVLRQALFTAERARGLDHLADLASPGVFELAGEDVSLVFGVTGDGSLPRFAALAEAERRRRARLAPRDAPARTAQLMRAADAYLVRRGPGRTIIAGYPWFADWGRDTMICLPGLFLATGRRDEAFRTLVTFARARRRGLIPNHFDDYAGPAHYNTVDAPLWFVHACCQYLKETGDRPGFAAELLPACDEVVLAYRHGTDHNIHADPADGLISAGDPETQLTWMDARRDGVTFTPRWGKAVEINALWHNALAGLAEAVRPDAPAFAVDLEGHARRVADSFRRVFLGGPLGGLIDHLTPTGEDGAWEASLQLRPNQVFAVSLPHSALTPEDQRRVIDLVADRLLTPVGLRTLDADDPAYRPRFEGDMFKRDGAYHNGTVWPWLIGPYAEGVLRAHAFSDASRERARAAIIPLIDSMDRDLLGQIAEVYDADEPRRADGCLAQAWSVAEPLRAYALSLRD